MNTECDVNSEPEVQIIDRGDQNDAVTILELDDLIRSRAESVIPQIS